MGLNWEWWGALGKSSPRGTLKQRLTQDRRIGKSVWSKGTARAEPLSKIAGRQCAWIRVGDGQQEMGAQRQVALYRAPGTILWQGLSDPF